MIDRIKKLIDRNPVLTKSYLLEEYFNKKRSIFSLRKEHKICNNLLRDLFEFYGISLRDTGKHLITTEEEKIEKILKKFPFASKDFFEKEYVFLEKSLPDIKNEYGLDFNQSRKLLKFYNIKIRSISESTLTSKYKKKLKATLTEKYGEGICNISQIKDVKDKKRDKCLSSLGVDNFFKQSNIKEIIERGFQKKYNRSISEHRSFKNKQVWASLSAEEKQCWLEKSCQSDEATVKQVGYRSSKGESIISDILSILQITHTRQLLLKYEENNKKRRFFYDIFIQELNLIIEFNGDYWHANPTIYKASDLIHYRFGNITAEDIWLKDLKKKKIAELKGYNIITIWESEIKNLTKTEILNLIQNKIYEAIKN